jgi:hypothetical protein
MARRVSSVGWFVVTISFAEGFLMKVEDVRLVSASRLALRDASTAFVVNQGSHHACPELELLAFEPTSYRTRRWIIGGLASAIPLTTFEKPSVAADPTTFGEAIRSAAQKGVPSSYGPTDVFYPISWKGLWNASRVRMDDSIAASYQVRFVTSIQDDSVILDRGFSQASLEKVKGVTSVEWRETNPNVMRVIYGDGSWKELKVTKRATERNGSTVSSSEVYRITTQPNGLAVPTIAARRVLTKWKTVDDSTVEGIELIYGIDQEFPTLLSKTRITLKR